MDASVISLEKVVIEFQYSLSKRGFNKSRFVDLHPMQKTGSLKFHLDLIGLMLIGDVVIEASGKQVNLTLLQEFQIPSDTVFELHAGEHGAKIIYGTGLISK